MTVIFYLCKFCLYTVLTTIVISSYAKASPIRNFEPAFEYDQASVRTEGDKVIASTGLVERQWVWGGEGLVTVGLKDLRTGKEWSPAIDLMVKSDWEYKGYLTGGQLKALKAFKSNDEGFADPHIELQAEVEYRKVSILYSVWIFPGAEGFRTSLKIKKNGDWHSKEALDYDTTPSSKNYSVEAESKVLTGRVEHIPIVTQDFQFRAIGYYNHTQGRNRADTPLLREKIVERGNVGWASILSLETPDGGIIIVKESHKCVNQTGVNTGIFVIGEKLVSSTGWGILPRDLNEKYQGYWANWLIIHQAKNQVERQLAIKKFDRTRYPIDPDRDVYIMANTWGSGETKNWSQKAAREENV